ncbi:MAG TPA: glutamate--tRNA ligase family protein, partial [Patescibacteria group bacterium]
KHDGEVIRQSQRLDLYKKYVQELLDKKIAHEKDGAIWVKVPEDKKFDWIDEVGSKKISFVGKDVDEFVILKSDGYPTYHLANIVDDHLMEITHVIRGEEWISSTPKHLYLYESFGWKAPKFAHLPVILGPDKTKLSKRHGAKSVLDYASEGYLQESLLNFMALLGWNPGGDKEQFSMDELIKLFELKDVNTANPVFDIKKLEWLNGVWIRSVTDLDKRLLDFFKEDKKVSLILKSSKAQLFVNAAASRMKTLDDFKSLISEGDSTGKFNKEEKETTGQLLKFLESQLGNAKWPNEKFLAALKNFSSDKKIPFKRIYFLLTKKEHGIGLLELNEIYGKDFFIKNLKNE